jgi:hypothetical protein
VRSGRLGGGAAVCRGGGSGWPSGTMVTFLRYDGRKRLVLASRSTRAMVLTTSTLESSHWPKMV